MEQVLGHRTHRGRREYLIKWKGYSDLDNTYEPLSNLGNALDAVKEYNVAKGITSVGVMSYLDTLKQPNVCNLGGATPGLAAGNLVPTAMVSEASRQTPGGKENCQKFEPVRLNSDRFRTGNDRCRTQTLGLRAVQGNCQRGARVLAISGRKTRGPGAENPEEPRQLEIAAPRASEPPQQLTAEEEIEAAAAPTTAPAPEAMESTSPSGLPDQTSRGQAGRGLGEVLEPQPLEHTGPAAMAEAPAEVVAAVEGEPPTQVAAEQGAAATYGEQPELVTAAMEVDSPVRAGSSVPVTGAVTELATGAAMEGVPVEGQAALEEEELPGPLAMVVYTGGASGVAAEIGAATATATASSPVQGAAPVTLAPATPSLSPEAVEQQRTGSLGRLYGQTAPTTAHGASGWAPAATTRESMPKRKEVEPAVGERRSSRVAKAAVASPETGTQPVSPEVVSTGETDTGAEQDTGAAVVTGAGTVATGSREDWYTRKGEITQTKLMEALVEAEPFTFIRLQGVTLPYASRDPTVRPPPALAALKLEEVITLRVESGAASQPAG